MAAARGALAQPRVPRIGLVSAGVQSLTALQHGLRDAGYVAGQTIVIEHRRTEGRAERYQDAVDAALKSGVQVLVVGSRHALAVARDLTRTVPVVAVDLETDPVASGFVASLARPGGNITGLFLDLPEMTGKLLQFLREAVPGVGHIAALFDGVIGRAQLEATQAAARAAVLTVHPAPIAKAADIEAALDAAVMAGARALVVLSAPLMRQNQTRIDEIALRRGLPSVTFFALLPNGSGFMSYGPNLDDMYRRAASYVDRILKGERVADLPVERPARFELAVNLRTAKALKVTLSPALLLRADRVIE
jgi:putative ABC transport system substrate-binding protein